MIKKIFLIIKNNILLTLLVGILVGLICSWVMYEGLHRTSNDRFCIVCHEMRPMVAAYHTDVHGGNGKTGIKVDCVTCHLPHDNIFAYIATKARNGVMEGAIHFFGNPDAIDWQANRANRQHFVRDEACYGCHTNYKTNEAISVKGREMHEHYVSLKGTDKEIGCASCHVEIGHNGLRSMLNYYNPEYKFYKGKLDKQKEAVEKKLTEDMK